MDDYILVREVADPRVSGVLQAVLLFGSEMWVLTPRMERALVSFQHRVGRNVNGRNPRRRGGGLGLSATSVSYGGGRI